MPLQALLQLPRQRVVAPEKAVLDTFLVVLLLLLILLRQLVPVGTLCAARAGALREETAEVRAVALVVVRRLAPQLLQ